MAYSNIGPYQSGVWLVVLKNGAAAIMDRRNLSKAQTGFQKPGTQYYWLGGDPNKAASRLPSALSKLNLDVSTFPTAQGLQPAFRGQIVGLSGDWGAPGGPGPAMGPPTGIDPTPTVPGAKYDQGPLDLSGALSSVTDFLKFIAWIFHPLNLLRMVEFLTGITLMIFGLHTLLGVMRRGSMTHRTTLGGLVGGLFGKSPAGRAARMASARRRGRRAGQVQGERDAAYRAARRERVGYDNGTS